MNTPARRFIVLVIVIVAAAAVVMAPRRDEWLAIMRDGDQQAQIIALLEPQLARNGDDPDLLATLGRSYAEIGDHPRAAALLERYIALRPDDGDAYAHLADLYNRTGDQDRRLAMLRRSLALMPRLSRAMELAGLYRDRRQTGEELAVLSCYESELTLESGLLLRLATLHVAHGDRERALGTLLRPAVLAAPPRPMGSQDERLYLAALLIESGHSLEAVRLGMRWIVEWHEPWLADRLLRVFALHALPNEASELAEAIAVLHPEVRFFLAKGLVNMGGMAVARHLLATWSTANPAPSANEIAAFLSACRDQDEPTIVWQAFAGALGRHAPNDIIARYSEAIAAEFGIGALAPFWASLPRKVIEDRPLLAARLAFHEHDLALTGWLLDRVDLRSLATPDRRMWIDLLTAILSPPEVFAVLRDRRSKGGLPGDIMADYARSAATFGQEMEYQAALADLRRIDRAEARHGIR
jgi:tetratricopeptide (TPR) repeat protein